MKQAYTYSQYTHSDEQTKEISALFNKTFGDSEGVEEGKVIASLAERLILYTHPEDIHIFIALQDARIVGCIIFTRLQFETDVDAFVLGPVAVHTDCQGQGVGQSLINHGLEALRAGGVSFVITYGDINYYTKVGFDNITEETVPAPLKLSYPEGWLGQSLIHDEITPIKGKSWCVPEFDNPIYW